jgi:hypothetical protein
MMSVVRTQSVRRMLSLRKAGLLECDGCLASLFMHSRHPNTTDAKRNGAACSVRCPQRTGKMAR